MKTANFIKNFKVKEFIMSALDKLINLIEEIKITSPDLRDKANDALNVLLTSETVKNKPEPPPLPPELEPEPEPEPEPFDDSYIEFDKQYFEELVDEQQRINDLITSYGLFEIQYQQKKIELSKKIAEKQEALNKRTKEIMKDIGCDPQSTYSLIFPQNDNDLPAFEKQ
tara:strand:- start:1456 stop:1962 length:507 start_codon:yes stop_codon:yes gene_type:complete